MAKTERVGVYPGTFDPTTNGHMDVIRRGARVLDRLVVGVAVNAGKGPLFSLDERVEMVRDEIAAIDDPRVGVIEVKPFNSLLMHFAEEENAQCILRGLRAVSDFDYEFQMAGMNARLNPDIEILFLMASESNQFIASRLVKEIAALGGDISSFVSGAVADRVNERYGRLDQQAANE
ncbi:MAG: pantetheine-phosphate adenylyltransferase [Alphaproteobacteria bacterium]|jgi:pantetheine-phosphate adenylyltransferase|nr:pantetheine-phosphate adenylyltransferase [Alphaproteobacteria bacterium]